MKKFLENLYIILIFLFVFPTGTIFHIPVKAILMVFLIFFYILYKRKIVLDELTVGILFIGLGIILWSLLSIINGFIGSMLKFDLNFVSLFAVIWITYRFHSDGIISAKKSIKYLSAISILIILFNLAVSLALTANILNFESFYAFYNIIFNVSPMTALIDLGPISIYRVQMPNNTIPFIWLGYTLVLDRKIIYRLFAVIMVAILAIVSFSRVLLAEFIIIIIGSLFIRLLQNSKKSKDEAISIAFVSIVIVLVFGVVIFKYGQIITNYIETRFNSNVTAFSDSFRDEQRIHLLEGFVSNPLIGHGAGSYVKEYIRSESALYSYELEYLSFLYQFGILGFLWIIVGSCTIFYYTCLKSTDNFNIKLLVLINLLIWTIKPFYNPNFLSSNSGIIISMIFVYSHLKAPSSIGVKINENTVKKRFEVANS